jgi:hypothetical protein
MKNSDWQNQQARERAGLGRRDFIKMSGLGVAAYGLMPAFPESEVLAQASVTPRNSANACIFIKLAGAPSHMDTFSVKAGEWTPDDWNIDTVNNITLPRALFPNLLDRASQHLAIMHSVQAYVPVHQVGQYWIDTSQDFNAGLAGERPALGAVVALEYEARRRPADVLPGFVALIGTPQGGNGFLNGSVAPFPIPGGNGQQAARLIGPAGVPGLAHPRGPEAYDELWGLMNRVDRENRTGSSPWGKPVNDYNDLYQSARRLSADRAVSQLFQYTDAQRQAYGSKTFGDACLVARNLVAANKGTRFVHITFGGWDHHNNVYQSLRNIAPTLDAGLAGLITELANTPSPEFPGRSLLDKTLIVVMGEFGRTPPSRYPSGTVSARNGRDHYANVQFCAMAGGGVRGGKNIGVTNADGSVIMDPGWWGAGERRGPAGPNIRMEDIGVTIYSTLGINWTTERRDTPSRRVYQYINGGTNTYYREVRELFE